MGDTSSVALSFTASEFLHVWFHGALCQGKYSTDREVPVSRRARLRRVPPVRTKHQAP